MAEERIIKPIAKTLIRAYEKDQTPPICSETGSYGNINTSQTLTRLVQETGRFTERFASDLFIDWKHVENIIGYGNWMRPKNNETHYLAFGIRRDGVDGNAYVIRQLIDTTDKQSAYLNAEKTYRRLFILKIQLTYDEIQLQKGFNVNDITCDIVMELKDLTEATYDPLLEDILDMNANKI